MSGRDILHTGLDIAGLIPAIGESADFTNGLMYMREKQYLMASLSFISMIPEIGDIVGKGIKYTGKALDMHKYLAKYGQILVKAWDKIVPIITKIDEVKPHIKAMQLALQQFVAQAPMH